MIHAVGLRSDATFTRFVARAADCSHVSVIDLRDAVAGRWVFPVGPTAPAQMIVSDRLVELRPHDGFFCRIIDLAAVQTDARSARRWEALCNGLSAWLEHIPGPVANRGRGGDHNGSKPLHEALLAHNGFRVPESVTTCDLAEITDFLDAGRAVSKTVCGVRADAVEVTRTDFAGFEPAAGPVHLQRLIEGMDARLHVVGEQVIAQRVQSPDLDYRTGDALHMLDRFVPDPAVADRVVRTSKAMGLALTGWDFKIDSAGRYWCLEVNPMPGFGLYDGQCEGAISAALVRYLGGVAC